MLLQARFLRGEVELGARDRPRTGRADDVDHGVQRRQRHRRVGRLHGDALVGPAEDRVPLVQARQRGAPAAGRAPVARPRHGLLGAEVGAAGALQHVAAERGPVADLRGRGLQARRGQGARVRDDERVLADLVQRGERADAQGPAMPAVAGDAAQLVEAADVDDPLGCGDAQPHPVQQLGAAREDGGVVVGERGDGGGRESARA